MVKPSITTAEDLRGKTIATPQLGNTQDVALRYWLKQKGFTTTKEGGGDVKVKPQDNAVTVDAFKSGAIDGAWVPEPTASRLVAAGGKVLLDERDLWPDGKFVITNLLVSTTFLDAHRDVVKKLIKGLVASNAYINANPADAQTGGLRRHRQADRQAAGRQADGRRVAVDHLPQRPDPVHIARRREARRGRGPARAHVTSTESTT